MSEDDLIIVRSRKMILITYPEQPQNYLLSPRRWACGSGEQKGTNQACRPGSAIIHQVTLGQPPTPSELMFAHHLCERFTLDLYDFFWFKSSAFQTHSCKYNLPHIIRNLKFFTAVDMFLLTCSHLLELNYSGLI